jgi:NADH-quinone oxidoreductase subunit L
VNGTGTLVRAAGGQVRKGQTGFIRGYAAIVGLGVVLMLAWFVLGRGVL